MKKKTLILFLIIFSLMSVIAQTENDTLKAAKKKQKELKKVEKKSRNRYIAFNLGSGVFKTKDKTVSPLLYKGNMSGAGISYMRIDRKKVNFYDLKLSMASLELANSDIYQGSNSAQYNFGLDIFSLYGITDIANKIRFYLGWHLNTNFNLNVNTKYMNSALNTGLFLDNGFTFRFDLPFSWKAKNSKFLFIKIKRKDRQLRASWMISMPLFAHVLYRPEYAGITNFVDGKSTFPTTLKTSTYGTYFALNSRFEILYELGNYNMLKLAYNWDFLHYNPGYNKLQTASHYVMLSFVFKLNKHTKSVNYVKEANNE